MFVFCGLVWDKNNKKIVICYLNFVFLSFNFNMFVKFGVIVAWNYDIISISSEF